MDDQIDVAKDGEEVEEYTMPGMPDTVVFWNANDTISIKQERYDAVVGHERDVIITVMPEMVERLCGMLRGVRDQMHNL